MCTESFIVYVITKEVYADIGKDVEAGFDISNYELERVLPRRKNKKINGLMKDELV